MDVNTFKEFVMEWCRDVETETDMTMHAHREHRPGTTAPKVSQSDATHYAPADLLQVQACV